MIIFIISVAIFQYFLADGLFNCYFLKFYIFLLGSLMSLYKLAQCIVLIVL